MSCLQVRVQWIFTHAIMGPDLYESHRAFEARKSLNIKPHAELIHLFRKASIESLCDFHNGNQWKMKLGFLLGVIKYSVVNLMHFSDGNGRSM